MYLYSVEYVYRKELKGLRILLFTKKFTDISDIPPPVTYINNTVLRVIMLIKVCRTTVENYWDGTITFIDSDN